MSKAVMQHLGAILLSALAIVLAVIIGWDAYRYGGETYYLRIQGSVGAVALTEPVGVTLTGHQYRGQAVNTRGQYQLVKFKTFADNPTPLHRGQIVKLTVNRRYGVTNYHVVSAQQVPATLKPTLAIK